MICTLNESGEEEENQRKMSQDCFSSEIKKLFSPVTKLGRID